MVKNYRPNILYREMVSKSIILISRLSGIDRHLLSYQIKCNLNKVLNRSSDLVESCLPIGKKGALINCLKQTQDVVGNIVECGVYRGGGTLLMAEALRMQGSSKHIFGFDTFEGMPPAQIEDQLPDGKAVYESGILGTTSLSLVNYKIKRFGHEGRVSLYKGYFQDTLPQVFQGKERFSLIFIDCDQYAGTKFCLEFLYDRVNAGGMILLDDYFGSEDLDTPGVKVAVDNFLRGKPEEPDLKHLALSLCGFLKK